MPLVSHVTAHGRSSSMPLSNPFWSERMQREAELVMLRPRMVMMSGGGVDSDTLGIRSRTSVHGAGCAVA